MTRESYIEINDLALVSVLLALGIPFCDEPFIKVKTVRGEQYKFFLKEESTCGMYKTLEMMRAWSDENFHVQNPEHPLAYMKCAYTNRNGLLDVVNQSSELVVIEKNGKKAVLSKNASEETKKAILSQI
jgi:hypothetical protein